MVTAMMHNWKNVLITPSSTILEALEVINKEALRVALVIDTNGHLIGVVTDGDVRRGLLNGLSLHDTVIKIMNTNPTTAEVGLQREELISLMESKCILSIPLIENGQVVGLETIQGLLSKPTYDNPIFIMAGGLGTRLRPLTNLCPKPMLKVGGKPLLEILINQFLKAGFMNIYISTHYMPEQITSYFGDGLHEKTPLGTGGALGLLPADTPPLPLIMINGDVLTTVDFNRLLDFHNKYQPTATMCVREYDYQIPYGVIHGDGHHIINMQEKPILRYLVNAGIYVVSPDLFMNMPKNERIDMPTLLEQQIAKQADVLMFPINEYWLDIGRIDDFNKAQIDIKDL